MSCTNYVFHAAQTSMLVDLNRVFILFLITHLSQILTGQRGNKYLEHIHKLCMITHRMLFENNSIIIRLTCQFHLKWVARLLCLF